MNVTVHGAGRTKYLENDKHQKNYKTDILLNFEVYTSLIRITLRYYKAAYAAIDDGG